MCGSYGCASASGHSRLRQNSNPAGHDRKPLKQTQSNRPAHARYPLKLRSTTMPEESSLCTASRRTPWNKGKLIGAKPPLRPNQVWSIRTRLMIAGPRETLPCSIWRSTANSAAVMCWPLKSRTSHRTATQLSERATVRQRKTGRPVKFELTEQTRQAIEDYLRASARKPGEFLFASRRGRARCMTTRQYARLVAE